MSGEVAISVPDIPVEAHLLRVDLTPGGEPFQDFAKLDFDLKKFPWPLVSDSVDEIRCGNYFQKLDGPEQVTFVNELHRVMKSGKGALIAVPFAFSVKAWQDPFNKRPVVADSFFVYDKKWRENQKMVGGEYEQITADFDISFPTSNVDQMLMTRSQETQQWMTRHLINTVHDLIAQLVKK